MRKGSSNSVNFDWKPHDSESRLGSLLLYLSKSKHQNFSQSTRNQSVEVQSVAVVL